MRGGKERGRKAWGDDAIIVASLGAKLSWSNTPDPDNTHKEGSPTLLPTPPRPDNAPVEDLSRVGQLVKALPAPVQKLVRRVRATPKAKIRVPTGSTFIFAARPYGNGFTLEGVCVHGGGVALGLYRD